MTVANVSVPEGDIAKFLPTLVQRYYQPIVVSASTTNGTATTPVDYGPVTNKPITIAAGTKTKNVWIQTNLDTVTEPAQSFTLTLTTSSVNNSPQAATGTIQANNT